ncbi:MAG TPA: PilZ domain-containing protein [Planctomycetota bacterium]
MKYDGLCKDCGKPLAETRISGAGYCEACVGARSLSCHTCRETLSADDFAAGRAVTLLGRRYCQDCLETAVQKGRQEAESGVRLPDAAPDVPSEDSVQIRRLYGRYVAPGDAKLIVKAGGLAGFLRGNLARLWLDVSEGGFRAIVGGLFQVDAALRGSIVDTPRNTAYPFRATVMHVRASQRYPNSCLVGCRFEAPSVELRSFLQRNMSGRPATFPAPPLKPTRRPSSTSIPPPNPARA